MIWYGQYNAILVLSLIASIGIGFLVGNWEIPFLAFFLVIIVRLSATFINLVANAFFGFPLIYDTKIQMIEAKQKRNAAQD